MSDDINNEEGTTVQEYDEEKILHYVNDEKKTIVGENDVEEMTD